MSYEDYKNSMQKIADLKYAAALLQWDQETYLPKKGAAFRGQQIATLTELAHELFTDEKIGLLLQSLAKDTELSQDKKRNVELSFYDYNKSKKLPSSFVRIMSEKVNTSFYAWIEARKQNKFAIFEKPLQDIIELKKEEAKYLGYEKHPYDALMNDYDMGLTVDEVDKLFTSLQPQLQELLDQIKLKAPVNNSFLQQHYDKNVQWQFGLDALKNMGYDFEAGRQDISEHPFTINFSSQDVRVTTRVDEQDFSNMLWSCIHEGGHALYEQGLPVSQYGLPLGEYCSLSIHESQSRLWENNVGRSKSYWTYWYPIVQEKFNKQLGHISLEDFYRGINQVTPSFIRTEADELTYHFHVMIRYEIEKLLIGGEINAKDIPTYWNEQYQKYLGIKVADDKTGCLQDVHWSHGSFGYFATYSLGSLYAAQLFAKLNNTEIQQQIASGDSSGVLQWLRKNIHPFGRTFNSAELCKHATGETLNSNYFIDYAKKKYGEIYGL